ncbi:HAMP domain-containing sensor histidine kinase [Nocardia yamanashiensis]|uniref:HAMP domain-containing sensor histidine kinase n=1 Tax=Nocardia yamanashiensis TaxID=209247 RepID=UPI0008352632|nr:HAMP domain-containing sensor histidine kinase [Nocardia yamanashiensis]
MRRAHGRPFSLRTRVALASAATAAIVVAAIAAVLFAVAPNDANNQVGRVVKAIALEPATVDGRPAERLPALPTGSPGVIIRTTPDAPEMDFSRTLALDGTTVTVAVPHDVATDSVVQQRIRIVLVGVAAIVLAAVLGWFFASRAVAPLRRLTTATADLGDELSLRTPRGPMASETGELADAMNTMLTRIAAERRHTDEALVTARDFAATAAHELRTPLTAMRTDLQVLRSMELSDADRDEILDEVLSSQRSIESTLYALERLAMGDLTTESDWEDLDLGQLVDQVVEDARRSHPDTQISAEAVEPVRLHGLAAGLRSVIDNAITNAIRHGKAGHIEIAAHTTADLVTLTIDDDGTGIPEAQREKVFERFYRGGSEPGNGLGLALVAQQARLHGGTARITESPLGGARLSVTLSCVRAVPR